MCRNAPTQEYRRRVAVALGGIVFAAGALAQAPARLPASLRPDWRRAGNSAIELYLAAPVTGPVARVWYSQDGARLFAQTGSGHVYESTDFETWKANSAVQPPPADMRAASSAPRSLPEPEAAVRPASGFTSRLYAMGRDIYRSDDGGLHWSNLTRFRLESIIGDGLHDLSVSPADSDEVAVASEFGVWRSLDGGLSWSGLNESLPNLPAQRILGTPAGPRGLRILLDGLGALEWAPGERQAWRLVADQRYESNQAALGAARAQLGEGITTVAIGDLYSYAGAKDGKLWVSSDKGLTWRSSLSQARGAINALYVSPADSQLALAAVSQGPEEKGGPQVLRTLNGGAFWDDLTGNLLGGKVNGIAADGSAGAVYLATDRGVFFAVENLWGGGPAADWIPMTGSLPAVRATDVTLDPAGNQVYVALDGYGIYSAPAPHRFLDPRVVNAADLSGRAAAPGSLLSVMGARLLKAQAGLLAAPVLHASDAESQIQIPFEAAGSTTRLSLEASRGHVDLEVLLREVSPAIFVDRDGTPLLLDAESGVMLDAMNPTRSNARIQILATGLGRVRPPWPTGMTAPLETPPNVVAPVHVYLDGAPLEVTRATLAPGYVGFYLVEAQLPALVSAGAGVVHIESGGVESNRVRIYLEP